MVEPPWLMRAREDIGLREIPGPKTAVKISQWLHKLRVWWTDDETPWCGVAAAAWIEPYGVALPKAFYRAKAWLDWGVPLSGPLVGAIVVFTRVGGGHVGFVVGKDPQGRLLVLGGNQSNSVSIMAFEVNRVAGYRWPKEFQDWPTALLPTITAQVTTSRNEA